MYWPRFEDRQKVKERIVADLAGRSDGIVDDLCRCLSLVIDRLMNINKMASFSFTQPLKRNAIGRLTDWLTDSTLPKYDQVIEVVVKVVKVVKEPKCWLGGWVRGGADAGEM